MKGEKSMTTKTYIEKWKSCVYFEMHRTSPRSTQFEYFTPISKIVRKLIIGFSAIEWKLFWFEFVGVIIRTQKILQGI